MNYSQVYLDNISSAPTPAEACEEMERIYEQHYAIPGAFHQWGQWSKSAFEVFAEKTASLLGAQGFHTRFTIGAQIHPMNNGKILVSPIEAKSVMREIEQCGLPFERFQMNGYRYDLDFIEQKLKTQKFSLIVATSADRITGTIQPIEELSGICAKYGAPVYCDISPLIGRSHFDFEKLGVQYGFVEGRLFGAPCDLMIGQKLDFAFPLPMAAGFSKTLELLEQDIEAKLQVLNENTKYFWELMQKHLPHLTLLGDSPFIEGVLAIAFEDVDRGAMMLAVDMQGVAMWAGDSFSGQIEQLKEMNVPDELADSMLRFSLWHNNTTQELDYVLRVIPPLVDRIRFEKKSPKFRA